MRKVEITTLYDFTYWANRRLLNVVNKLSSQQLDQVILPGSPCVLDILAHSLGAEIMWWTRLAHGTTLPAVPGRADFPAISLLIDRWSTQEERMRVLLGSLSEDDLAQLFRYTTTKGKVYEMPRWQLLMQLVNHETQHRAEVAMLVTALGKSPGDLDFILYLREKSG